jgi:hypothetical protein
MTRHRYPSLENPLRWAPLAQGVGQCELGIFGGQRLARWSLVLDLQVAPSGYRWKSFQISHRRHREPPCYSQSNQDRIA